MLVTDHGEAFTIARVTTIMQFQFFASTPENTRGHACMTLPIWKEFHEMMMDHQNYRTGTLRPAQFCGYR